MCSIARFAGVSLILISVNTGLMHSTTISIRREAGRCTPLLLREVSAGSLEQAAPTPGVSQALDQARRSPSPYDEARAGEGIEGIGGLL